MSNAGKKKQNNGAKQAASRRPRQAATNEEQVRKRAYEIFIGRGATPGHDLDDWLAAERELRRR
jgi:hypothetical protein